jgi:hypothetical protein
MKKYLLFILFFANVYLNAQAPRKFFTRFGGYGHDIGYSVIQTLNGHYAVTGSTGSFGNGNSDVYLAFVDSMGWVRWEKSYGGFNNDIGKSIIQLADSGFVIAGYTNSFGAGGYDMLVVRTDKAGTLIWQKTFGGLDWDFANAVKATPLGDSLIIAGNTYSFGYGKSDGYIVKTDLNGIFQWQKTYGGAEDDEFKSFVLTYNNQYAFAGTTKSMGDVKGDCWLFKTGLAGDSLLAVKYGNNNKQFVNDIKEHPITKNLVFCGGYDVLGLDSTSAMLLCLNENGIFQFEDIFSYHEQKDEQFVATAYFKNNDFLYIRKSINSSFDKRLQPMISQFSNNNYVNATKYGSTDDDELFCISKTRDKGFISVGYTKGLGANLSDVFLLKLDSVSLLGATSMVGINEPQEKQNNFSVYPTITNSEVVIENNSATQVNIYISDCLGKLIYQTKNNESVTKLDLSGFNEGIYLVTLSNTSFSKTFKVIKSN